LNNGGISVIKNNIKSLLIHLLISVLSLVVYLYFHFSAVKWVSEEAYQNHQNSMLTAAFTVIAAAIFLYFQLGKKICKDQGSKFKNIISVSITAVLSIFLWITAFNIDLTGGTDILLNSELWGIYSLFNTYCLFLVDEAKIKSPYIMLIFSFIPALSMNFGIRKNKENLYGDYS
jgi:Mg2+/citrate symporter